MAPATARTDPASPLGDYVRARAAASNGSLSLASEGFSAALTRAPDNEIIATEALTHAVGAGDWPLALRAAGVLERRNALLPDARFLLLAQAFRSRDWRAAQRHIDAVEREQAFAFVVPVLRAWLAVGSRRGDALSFVTEAPGMVANPYSGEHRPLLMAATGRSEGVEALLASAGSGPRGQRLRIAAAATLAERRKSEAALALLAAGDSATVAARALIADRKPVPGAVATPAEGLAELLIRLALDMHGQGLGSVATGFARLAAFAAPDNSQAWMLAAELLARDERPREGVALLANVAPTDPYRSEARDQRIRLLAEAGQGAVAVTEAQATAQSEEAGVADHVRHGQALMAEQRPAEAAEAFARALRVRRATDTAFPEWALWLFRGGAHDEAGQWPEARAALERAYSLAPDQPLVLNYLGYAQLQRGENLIEAERLVREARRLAPDNPAITDSLGWALYLKGELSEAITLLEMAAAGEPADVEINEHLGDAYFRAGRRSDARFAWAAARVYAEREDAARRDAKLAAGLNRRLAAR